MRTATTKSTAPANASARNGPLAHFLRPVGRFGLHLLEMCMVMCFGAVVMSVIFFGGAWLLGYTDLARTAPELSALVVALNLSVPMAAWMRWRGMEWRPTLEMAGSTMVVGLGLIVAYWLNLIAKESLIEVQASLACPVMLVVMLVRFRLYSADHSAHSTRHAHTA